MTDPLTPLVDTLADRVITQITPVLVEAVEARKLPALAVSVTEAAAALHLSEPLVRRLVRDGHLRQLDGVGTAMRITVASLHAYAGHPLKAQLHAAHEVAS